MFNGILRSVFIVVFAAVNTIFLYLFLLQLPYGIDTFIYSLMHWSQFSPRIEIVAVICVITSLAALSLRKWPSGEWKSRLLYFRRQYAHPGHRAFFGGKDPGFDRQPLLAAYPEVRDSAYNPQVQMRVWRSLLDRHAEATLVKGTYRSWVFLTDLYLISLVFLAVFLLTWPLNFGVPLVLALSFVFVYGAQFLFLMFSARGTGTRLESNVLAEELGMRPQANSGTKGKRDKKR
jgi:hypothetical protein